MRAAPAAQFTLSRFGAWRAFEALLGAAACGAVSAWAMQHAGGGAAASWLPGLAAAATGALISAANRRAPVRLSWDGRVWRAGPASEADVSALPAGDLRVMLDLGAFLLLRFEPADGARARWLPLQRAGLEADWHAIRCAVYSPRLSSASASVDASPPPA